ncbi:HNH endonuclease [Microbacterium oxydans]|nr:HNH endonuclease [Microbacterium oxydans]
MIPTDTEFKIAFISSGKLTLNRAKYVLAMLEKAADAKFGRPERALDWTSTAVTIEHVLPQSSAGSDDALQVKIDEIGNLALLEKRLNHQLGSKPFEDKRDAYRASDFGLTKELADLDSWTTDQVTSRTASFADLACLAWPAS